MATPVTASVLVVSYDPAKQNQLEGWLEAAGYDVGSCPGPGIPVACPQIHGCPCPLVAGIDLVILDLKLEGDFREATAPGWVLLDTYLERGVPVVAMADPADYPPILNPRGCTLVPRSLDQGPLIASVQRALAVHPAPDEARQERIWPCTTR